MSASVISKRMHVVSWTIPENRLLPLYCAVTFAQISSIAIHRYWKTRNVHGDLYNNESVSSPFCRNDKDRKDAIGKHCWKFMAHFMYLKRVVSEYLRHSS